MQFLVFDTTLWMLYGYGMRIHRQNLDPTAAPIEMSDRIFMVDGVLNLVLDEDIFDEVFDTDSPLD